jgi:hypothetical protein
MHKVSINLGAIIKICSFLLTQGQTATAPTTTNSFHAQDKPNAPVLENKKMSTKIKEE